MSDLDPYVHMKAQAGSMCRCLDRRGSWGPSAASQHYRHKWHFAGVSGPVRSVLWEEAHKTVLQTQRTGIDNVQVCSGWGVKLVFNMLESGLSSLHAIRADCSTVYKPVCKTQRF